MLTTIQAMELALAAGEKFVAKCATGKACSVETLRELQASNEALRNAIKHEKAKVAVAIVTCQGVMGVSFTSAYDYGCKLPVGTALFLRD